MAECGDGLLLARLCTALAQLVRVTAPRRALLEQLAADPAQCWTADELLTACNAANSGTISRPSVYRTLELLETADIAEALPASANGQQRYQLTEYALAEIELCDGAGGPSQRVPADAELRRALRRVCSRHGYTLSGFSIQIEGQFAPKPPLRKRR